MNAIIKINDVEYVRKDQVSPVINVEDSNSIASSCVGMNVIVRSKNAGVHAGTVIAADGTGVVLSNSRRLWYHKPKLGAWYEGICSSGIDDTTKVSHTVDLQIIVEDYLISKFSNDEAYNSIFKKTPHNE